MKLSGAKSYIATIDAARCRRQFRDVPRFLECCRKCPSFGKSWGCPPLAPDIQGIPENYSLAEVMAIQVVTPEGLRIDDSQAFLRPYRIELETTLLRLEEETGGRAFSIVGECLHCPPGSCTRPAGLPCRHPEFVRPSLGAYGFDVGAMTKDLFGLELLWGHGGFAPGYLVIAGAVFYNP